MTKLNENFKYEKLLEQAKIWNIAWQRAKQNLQVAELSTEVPN